MQNSKEIFRDLENGNYSGVVYKTLSLKKKILSYFSSNGDVTIADLCGELNSSVPTITKLLFELIEDGYVLDYGKIETGGGRRPNNYGLNPQSGFFVGVEVKRDLLNIAAFDFKENLIDIAEKQPFVLSNSPESLESLCSKINAFVDDLPIEKDKILGLGVNLSGRVNSETGYSHSFFHFEEEPLSKIIESRVGIKTYLENDTRAMTYGEYESGVVKGERNVLFVNLSRGVGLGMIIDGKLYYGKSGFSGEFGHIPFFENEILCHCGKKGCLETEASGIALERLFVEKLEEGSISSLSEKYEKKEKIVLEDIIEAANNEDVLAIELIAQVGEKMGRAIAMLMNIFNPELVVLGGAIPLTGDYVRLPIKSAINKYSLSLVSSDTNLKISKLGLRAGVVGACLLVRRKLLGAI
ncbi:MAG: ROK family transcriptional regulator [Bacteroidota bacterium]|nr:ROK family transcriptional regulator [Bacteroidota bacterium]MDP4205955.1 ROK family transcriptional regulator [Bacteroidota bacterium]